MENKGLAKDAIASAMRWLSSAKSNASAGNYDTAIYSMEMAVEIALKAVLFALNIDVPKAHSIGDIVKGAAEKSDALPGEFREEIDRIVSTFNALMDLRAVSGYVFETKSTLAELKKKYNAYGGAAEKIVKLCEKAVDAMIGV